MNILVKTLSGKSTPLTVKPDWPLAELKREIERQMNFKAEFPTLVANSEVLRDDDVKVKDTGIAKVGFVVIMVSKRIKKRFGQKKEEPSKPVTVPSQAPP